ncbi:MAG TPA: isochorismatase family cysteine hydrolase [Burkholderiaceae bacterium]|nr:isochorismatase family cysteine hydrolase [Burkholderiaceae bacterium]
MARESGSAGRAARGAATLRRAPAATDAAAAGTGALERCDDALLLVDLISDFAYPGGDVLLRRLAPAVPRIARLAQRAREAGVPVIYVNDNHGRWRSSFADVVAAARAPGAPGASVCERLAPTPDDYFVLKPRHSGFHRTPLDLLLAALGTRRVVIAGVSGDACVMLTAADAHLRGFAIEVPADCTASSDAGDNRRALEWMARVLHARTGAAASVRWSAGRRGERKLP